MCGPISHRAILPADQIEGMYNTSTRELTVGVRGSYAAPLIHGAFIFGLSPCAGPSILLVGWAIIDSESPDPVNTKCNFPYEFCSKFDINLNKGQHVKVIDLNNPQGIRIPVHCIVPDDQRAPEHPSATIFETKTIVTTMGTPFTIRGQSVGPEYNIDATFHPEFLTMLDATIEGGQIVWKFDAKQPGRSDLFVTCTALEHQHGEVELSDWVQDTYEVLVHSKYGE